MRVKGDRSVRQFALDLDVAVGTVQNWMSGSGLPNAENIEKIATAAGMSVQEFYDYLSGDEKTLEQKSSRDIFQIAVRNLDDEGIRELIVLLVGVVGRG
ncbi:hypothetical protein ACX27_27435 [Nostoc piscinale CENA21]|uniref:HTH cro/C1-type domain-containing protein n=2 Tax=Nostoc TaxID=1177 RepID=A0A0M4T869_9NOSO|nr:hypothetical protein ACX27_27435 [Nostoc piscinale CENA21]